jgi:hypothetical protein
MNYPEGVPNKAVCIHFAAENGKEGDYFFWSEWVEVGPTREIRFFWHSHMTTDWEYYPAEATKAAQDCIRKT